MEFSEEQRARYSRHFSLEGVGEEGQEKLLCSKVLVIGAGGLGTPVLMYLAAAGVGTIGIADGDRVDLSNLQRQVIHGTSDTGVFKAESAGRRIQEINPEVKTVLFREQVTAENIMDMISGYDFVIDAVDNFAAKFLINDACVLAGKPFCHAGVREFYGQAMTYVPGEGPCYRCVFEEIPPEGETDGSSRRGILGTIPGILGSVQALEAQKYLLGLGELLTGKIFTFDGLAMKCRTVSVEKSSEDCRVCGPHRDILEMKEVNYRIC